MQKYRPRGVLWEPVPEKPKTSFWPFVLGVLALLLAIASCSGTPTAEAEPTGETVNR